MNIAVVAHTVDRGDGQGRINYEIVRHCLRQRHHVTVLADQIASDLESYGATIVPIRSRLRRVNLSKVWRFVRLAEGALDRLNPFPEVIIGNGYVLRRPHDVNLCQFVHGAWQKSSARKQSSLGLYAWYQSCYTSCNARWERDAYSAARVVVAPARCVRHELESIGISPQKIEVIPNGVDPVEFHPGHEDRTKLGLPEKGIVALFVGDIRTSRKNLGTVLKALARLPELTLAVVGASDGSPFPQMARSLGVADRTHFLGFRSDVPQLMRACDFFVFPTRYEPFGLVVLEAMASGLPVVTTRCAGAAELIPEGCGDVLNDPDNVELLAAAMSRSCDPARRREAPRLATETAIQNTWEQMAAKYLRLLDRINDKRMPVPMPAFAGVA